MTDLNRYRFFVPMGDHVLTSTHPIEPTDQHFYAWVNETFESAAPKHSFEPKGRFVRDLILRETDWEPGVYDDPKDPLRVIVVVRDPEGKCRQLLWFEHKTGRQFAQPGDVVIEGAYPKAVSAAPEESEP